MAQDIETLKAYQLAKAYKHVLLRLANRIDRDFGNRRLSQDMMGAAQSLTANMCEGYGRFTWADRAHFFRISRGSTRETFDHLDSALASSYISNDEFQQMISQGREVLRVTDGYIAYLVKMDKAEKEKKRPRDRGTP